MQTTTNLGLKKPDKNEFVDVSILNYNSDTIDGAVGEKVNSSNGYISETVVDTLETVEDKFPIPSAGEKIKQFLGKILTFLKNIKPLEADVTYYVATTGSDTTGDGTSSKPFKTIQHALDILPKDLCGYVAYISVADGTYDEDVYIVGFFGGVVGLYRTTNSESLNTNCTIRHIICRHNSARVLLRGLNLSATSTHAFEGVCCSDVIIQYCQVLGTASTYAGFIFDCCNVRVENCKATNRESALHAKYNSNILSSNWATGSSGNTYGISSGVGGKVELFGSQPEGTTQQFNSYYGGIISNENGTQISSIILSGLSCTWGTLTGGYIRHGNSPGGVAMVTIQLTVTLTTTLTVNNEYWIHGFPIPYGSRVPVAVNALSSVLNSYLHDDGVLHLVPGTNTFAAGNSYLFNATYITNS